jgi:hypothetical protein
MHFDLRRAEHGLSFDCRGWVLFITLDFRTRRAAARQCLRLFVAAILISWRSQMSSRQQRITAVTDTTADLIAQLRELSRLRKLVRMALLSTRKPRRIDRRKRTYKTYN